VLHGTADPILPDRKIYAIGGSNAANTRLATVEAYDPGSDSWSTLPSLATARRNLAAGAIAEACNVTIAALGGHADQPPFTATEVFQRLGAC
jgi:N-acetylneuraminic acid mutarotase